MTTTPLLEKSMFWGTTPLFKQLSANDLRDLVALTKNKAVSTGETVIRQGDVGADMYLIAKGRVKVTINLADDEEIVIGEMLPGDAFGEIALFDAMPRTATVTALEPSAFYVLEREPFCGFLLAHPQVAIQILAAMSQRLRRSDDFIKESLYCNVGTRLADTLRKLAHAYGKNTREGLHIELAFSERELSEIAGVPASVVSAHLRHWQNEGLIKSQRGCLTLVRPEELAHA